MSILSEYLAAEQTTRICNGRTMHVLSIQRVVRDGRRKLNTEKYYCTQTAAVHTTSGATDLHLVGD